MNCFTAGDSQDLRIVLLGVCGAGKSSTANAILGHDAFKESRTRRSEVERGRVEDRNISIIDTPGFFNTQLTDVELRNEMIKGLYLVHPGPHVFLLIINLETFKDEDRNLLEQIQENFGAQALNFTLVLFTGREQITSKEWMDFKFSSKFQELVSHCRDKYHVINSKREIDPTQITKLLEKIEEIIKQNNDQHYDNDIYLKSYLKFTKEKKSQEKVKKDYRKNEQEKVMKKEQFKIVQETFKMHDIKEKSNKNVVTVKKSFISQETKTKRSQIQVYENRHSRVPEENNDEEKFEKQSVKSLRNSFEKMGVKNSLKKKDKSWKMDGTEICHQNNKTLKEQRPAQAESIKQSHIKPGKCTDLRIVMVGKTGVGKSATGNTILAQKVFKEEWSTEPVTVQCQQHQKTVEGRIISVIDTPGLFDTSISEEKLKEELVKCVEKSVPGPHVFLLVIRLNVRFTDEEKNTVKWIQGNFGEDAARYTIVLFTRGDELAKPIEKFLTTNRQINELVRQCKGGYHVFNNTDDNPSQVTELLEKIDRMVKENEGEHYSNKRHKDAQRKIEEEKENWRKKEEEQRKEVKRWTREAERRVFKTKDEEKRQIEEDRKKLEEEEMIREDEINNIYNKAKDVALVATGAAVVGGAVLAAAGVTLPAALISGATAAGTAALNSASSGATLSEVFKAGGAAALDAALTSATGNQSLSKAIMTGAAAALDAAVTSAIEGATLHEALMTGAAVVLDAVVASATGSASDDAPPVAEVSSMGCGRAN